MDTMDIRTSTMILDYPPDREKVEFFLKKENLCLDENTDYTMVLEKDDQIIATGSLAGRVLKSIAVDPRFKGMGLANKVVSHLIKEAYERGHSHLFIFTKPSNYVLFKDLGFYKIAEVVDKVVLLENRSDGLQHYKEGLKANNRQGEKVGAIVMNANPFTLGHQYLIEQASASCDVLHVFVVWEDQSSFPSRVRYDLIRQGTQHLDNVVIHRGKNYIISGATFPSYFLKDTEEIVSTHARLDLKIFGEHIAPALGITKRFVGEEPYCEVTNTYNRTMKKTLPTYGIEVVEMPRHKINGQFVSASMVRRYLKEAQLSKIKPIVPKTTYDYLTSKAALGIIKQIKKQEGRH